MHEDHEYKKIPELTNKQINEFGFQSPHKQITEDFDATVIKVIDGDTIRLRTDFRDFDFPLRMLNIDAPEMSEGGGEAREWLKGVIDGEEVQIKIDRFQRVGKYGRLLGRVISLGMDMGEAQIRLGLVVQFGQKKESEPADLNKTLRLEQWF